MPVTLLESTAFAEAATPATGPGRLLIRLIDAGKGSSGVYPAETLKAAAEARVFRAGMHMYVDHPSETEQHDRPERTIRDLAGVLAEDARWDEDAKALVAEARVYSAWRAPLAEMAADIGVSIRAMAETTMGDWNGQPAVIVSRITEGISADYVTHAGRGGKILLESARIREARNVGQWVESRIHRDFTIIADEMFGDGRLTREERISLSGGIGDALAAFVARIEADAPGLYQRDVWEEPPAAAGVAVEAAVRRGVAEATANDRREQLNALVKDAHGGKDRWVWVRDFDDSTVWFEDDDASLFQQAYTTTDDVATDLTGDRTEVRIQTTYVPVGESAPGTFGAALERMLAAVPLSTDTDEGQAVMAWLNEAGQKAGVTLATTEADDPAPTNVPGHPAGQTTQESEEDTMPNIEEARLRQLEEDAGRVHALESERDTAVRERDEANTARLQAEAGTYARDFARNLVTKANGDLAEASVARIVRDALSGTLPLTEAGRLDTDAFTPLVEKARQDEETYLGQVAEASGIGSVRGVGPTGGAQSVTESDVSTATGGLFGRDTKEA